MITVQRSHLLSLRTSLYKIKSPSPSLFSFSVLAFSQSKQPSLFLLLTKYEHFDRGTKIQYFSHQIFKTKQINRQINRSPRRPGEWGGRDVIWRASYLGAWSPQLFRGSFQHLSIKEQRGECVYDCEVAKRTYTLLKVGADKVNIVPDGNITLSFFISSRRPIETS